jgi:FkbM family methyltransferase
MKVPDFIEKYKGYWLLKNDQSISKEVKRHGKLGYDKDFINLPELNAMPKGSWVIDVGAFIGDTTSIFLDKGFNVVAFEPQKDAYECLKHNCPESINFNVALGNGSKVGLYNSDGGNMGGRPIVKDGDLRSEYLNNFYDDVIPKDVSIFLKLDAEGFEPAILAGATDLLESQYLKHIVCEFNPNALALLGYTCDDILKYLPNWEYREIFRYYDQNWDCIFTRK